MRRLTRIVLGLLAVSLITAFGFMTASAEPKEGVEPVVASAPKPDGRELFVREWIAGDPRSHRGDGLGPVFNDSSCVACHNQGGLGGGGPASKNVQILSRNGFIATRENPRWGTFRRQSFVLHHFGTDSEYAKWRTRTARMAARVLNGPAGGSSRGGRPAPNP